MNVPDKHLSGRSRTDDHNTGIDLLRLNLPDEKNKTVGKTNAQYGKVLQQCADDVVRNRHSSMQKGDSHDMKYRADKRGYTDS